ncbi:integrase core domain-containing protein [Kitasatospora sp. NPDC093558]|uniref:integrase core domain-containing protein n=1 Tax=Kitasatospora sp. NPDC093558 TaxID=3155201 RepID=UPI0034251FB2
MAGVPQFGGDPRAAVGPVGLGVDLPDLSDPAACRAIITDPSVQGVHVHGERPVCDRHGVRRSTGRAGSSYDNALAESLWQGLKREVMHRKLFLTMNQARLAIFQCLTYYNARRRQLTRLPVPPGVRTAAPRAGETLPRSMNPCVHVPGVTSAVNAPHLVALVRAGAHFERGELVEPPRTLAA